MGDISFVGLGNFRNQVLFAQPVEDEFFRYLSDLAAIFRDQFQRCEINHENQDKFNPHLTIAKTSRNFRKLRSAGIKNIPPDSYKTFKDSHFGKEKLSSVLFCSMQDKKADDGFYKV